MRLRPLALIPILISSLCVVLLLRMSTEDPRYLVPAIGVVIVALMPAWMARRRLRRVLMSGDVHDVLRAWQPAMERAPNPETMAPLMLATAYVSHGWLDAAHTALSRAVKGPAWEAAREQRLFVETLLSTFEGEQEVAKAKARELEEMPLPSGALLRRRVAQLRAGAAALVRAFAHESDRTDDTKLARAAKVSPLTHWAMLYAEAIVAIDRGDAARARTLLTTAPAWPKQSVFASFHAELLTKLA